MMSSLKQTYCTNCKMNVDIANCRYVRLANKRAVIEGQCSQCGMKLIKAKVMPRNSVIVKRERKGLL
jgi:RNase P subunit RPR2